MSPHPSVKDLCRAGQQSMRARRLGAARGRFSEALSRQPNCAPALAGLAWLAWEEDRDLERMALLLERAETAAPKDPVVQNMRANMHLIGGDLSRAEQAARRALNRDPGFVQALATLDLAAPLHERPADIRHLRRLAERPDLDAARRASCLFLLGKIEERRDAYDAAFEAYRRGNEVAPNSFDASGRFDNFRRILETVDAAAPPSADATDAPPVIFLVGMPRSGSTLLEQILSRHPRVASIGEARFAPMHFEGLFGQPALKPLGDAAVSFRRTHLDAPRIGRFASEYLESARRQVPAERTILDKNLYNFALAPLLARAFPGARIVHCRRNAEDVALSIFSNNLVQRPFGTSLATLGGFYRVYRRTMERWIERAVPGLVEVAYEDLASDPAERIPELLDRLGLAFDPACLNPEEANNPVRTASVGQVRGAIHRASIGRARPFHAHLAPFRAALAAPADD